MGKTIAIFIDGTWNEPDPGADTNVRKLFLACPYRPDQQLTYYLPGVGRDLRKSHAGHASADLRFREALKHHRDFGVARGVLGGVTGHGTSARIKEAYAYLSANYDRGDQVFIFGFSRGAFAACSLAGFVGRVGILLKDKIHLVERAYRQYENGTDASDAQFASYFRKLSGSEMLLHADNEYAVPVHMLGVWDVVGALGLPGRLKHFTAERTEYHQIELPPNVMSARHAIAFHELRKEFSPTIWRSGGHRDIKQVWFPGAHADVGGGYAPAESGNSDSALLWMAAEASAKEGLEVDHQILKPRHWQETSRVIHHQIRGAFALCRPTPRRQIQQLLQAHDVQACHHAMHCSTSLVNHASRKQEVPYQFKKPVRQALEVLDEQALRLILKSNLIPEEPGYWAATRAMPMRQHWWREVTWIEAVQSLTVMASFGVSIPNALGLTHIPREIIRTLAIYTCFYGDLAHMRSLFNGEHAKAYYVGKSSKSEQAKADDMVTWANEAIDLTVQLEAFVALLDGRLAMAARNNLDRFRGAVRQLKEAQSRFRGGSMLRFVPIPHRTEDFVSLE